MSLLRRTALNQNLVVMCSPPHPEAALSCLPSSPGHQARARLFLKPCPCSAPSVFLAHCFSLSLRVISEKHSLPESQIPVSVSTSKILNLRHLKSPNGHRLGLIHAWEGEVARTGPGIGTCRVGSTPECFIQHSVHI